MADEGHDSSVDPAGVRPFEALRGRRYVNLTTFRRSGQPVATPMWFVLAGDRLYTSTGAEAGKLKRIRANPRVLLEPSDARGRPRGRRIEALARVLPDAETGPVERLLKRKYGWQRTLVRAWRRLRGGPRSAYLEIRPATWSQA